MKLMAYRRRQHTADVYDWTILDDPNGSVVYAFSRTIACDVHQDKSVSNRVVIFTGEPLRKNVKLLNIVDEHGVELVPNGEFIVTTMGPEIDVFGRAIGFKSTGGLNNFASVGIA